MFEFLKMLKKSKAGSKEIRIAIDGATVSLGAARKSHDALKGQRGDLILDGEEGSLEELENKIDVKAREVERLELGIEALAARLPAVEAAEALAELDRKLRAAEKATEEGVKCIVRYGKHAKEIKEIMIELVAIEQIVDAANTAAKAVGDPREVKSPNGIAREKHTPGFTNPRLQDVVWLPAADANRISIWPGQGYFLPGNAFREKFQPTPESWVEHDRAIDKIKGRFVA